MVKVGKLDDEHLVNVFKSVILSAMHATALEVTNTKALPHIFEVKSSFMATALSQGFEFFGSNRANF